MVVRGWIGWIGTRSLLITNNSGIDPSAQFASIKTQSLLDQFPGKVISNEND